MKIFLLIVFTLLSLAFGSLFIRWWQNAASPLQYEMAILFIGMFIFCFFCLLLALLDMRRSRRLTAVLSRLPMQVMVFSAKGKMLFVHASGESSLNQVDCMDALPEELRTSFSETAAQVLESGQTRAFEYVFEGRKRLGEFRRIPGYVFGENCLLVASSDIEELRCAQWNTGALMDRFRQTLDAIRDGVISVNNEGVITFVNRTAARLIGCHRHDLIGVPLQEGFHVVDPARPEAEFPLLRKAFQTGDQVKYSGTLQLSARDGSQKHVSCSVSAIQERDGRVNGAIVIFHDETAVKEAEERKQDTEQLLQVVLDNLPCLIFLKDFKHDDRYLLTSSLFDSTLGREPGSSIGLTDYDLFPREIAAGYIAKDHEVMTAGNILEIEERRPVAGGKMRMMHTRKIRLNRRDGEWLLGVSFDITDLHESRNELMATNNLLKAIMSNLPLSLFVKEFENGQARYLMCNQVFYSLFNLKPENVIGKQDEDFYPAENLEACTSSDNAALESCGLTQYEEMIHLPDGKVCIMQIAKNLVQLEDNRRLLIGTCVDMTEERRLSDECRRLICELQTFGTQQQMLNSCLELVLLNDDEDSSIRIVLQTINEFFHADNCYMLRFDYEKDQMFPALEYCSEKRFSLVERIPRLPVPREDELFRALVGRRLLRCPDARSKEVRMGAWDEPVRALGIRSIFSSGIYVEDNLYGAVGISFWKEPHSFSKLDEQLLRSAAHLIEIILSRKRSRIQFARSEYEKRLILDTIPMPILLFDTQGKLVRANNAALLIAGRNEEEVKQQPCFKNFCSLCERPANCPVMATIHDEKNHSITMTIKGRDYFISAYPIFIGGVLTFVLKTLIDISESNAAQQKLSLALQEAQNANKAKSFFLATMSHELRTPLNAVIGFSELLQNNEVSRDEEKEYLKSINLAGNALLSLINDILDLSKLEAEQMIIVPQPTDVGELIGDLQSVFREKAQRKGLTQTLRQSSPLPILLVDSLRLRQILLNLIGNAIKFTSAGSVNVEVDWRFGENDKGILKIAIRDTGIGISAENKERIFEPFVQQDAVRDSHSYNGTGLGLAISRRLAEKMGGSILLESEVGRGSCFTLVLPEVGYSAPLPELPPAELPENKPKGIKALLVDDVPMNLKVLSAMLKKLSVEVSLANSGAEALKVLETELPAIIFTDLWMPGMNGMELVKAIRANFSSATVKVIAVTADSANRDNFDMSLFDGVLVKPIALEKLSVLIRQLSE